MLVWHVTRLIFIGDFESMLKKTTIYSIMALSLTLMPASEVLADVSGDLSITSTQNNPTQLSDTNVWTAGKITNTGGTLEVSQNGINYTTEPVPNYVQTTSASAALILNTNAEMTLKGKDGTGNQAYITTGSVSLNDEGGGAKLTVAYGAYISSGAKVTLGAGNDIYLISNTGGEDYSLELNNNSIWNGSINTSEGGWLSLNGRTNTKSGNYVQTDGGIDLTGTSSFNLNSTDDYIGAGYVNIGKNDSDLTKNTLIVSEKTSNASGQTIDRGAVVNIRSGNTLALSGNGTAILNGDTSGKDYWNGAVTVDDSAVLTISGRTDATDANKTYNQTGGTLELGDSTGASSLTLGSKESVINGTSTVKINNGSTLVFNNGNIDAKGVDKNQNTAKIITDNTQGNKLTVSAGSTLNTLSGSNIDKNAKVNVTGTLNIPTGSTVTLNNMAANGDYDYTTVATDANTGDTWDGSINLSGGTLDLSSVGKYTDGKNDSMYNQTDGTLNMTDATTLWLVGSQAESKLNQITGGTVNIGSATNSNNSLVIDDGSQITENAQVTVFENNDLVLLGNIGNDPSLVMSNNGSNKDVWKGRIGVANFGELLLNGFDNSTLDDNKTAIYQQEAGTLTLSTSGSDNSYLKINTDASYISGGYVNVDSGNTLHITTDTVAGEEDPKTGEIIKYEALLGNDALVTISPNANLVLTGTGTAILNDNLYVSGTNDTWNGNVTVGSGSDTPVLTLRNVTKDFTNSGETGTLALNSGTINVYGNANGGSHLTVYDVGNDKFTYNGGRVNVMGNDANTLSTFTTVVTKDGNLENSVPINLQGNAQIEYKMNGHNATIANVVPTGSGPNNTMVQSGHGILNLSAPGADLNMGYNLRVENGATYVDANSMNIGTVYAGTPYGDLQIGMPGNTTETNFFTNALKNNIYGNMSLYNAWYHTTNPSSTTNIGGNLYTGSGIDMMYGKINSINLAGTTTIDNLKLKIDVDPATYRADTINSSYVVTNPNSKIDLVDYKLLSTPRRDKYTFRVINAKNDNNYMVGAGAKKVVSQNKITWTPVGGYQMIPSSVKGAFDMVLTHMNPQAFRGQVAANVIYANQLAISNQLFDRMFYSNLPYFNDDCSNKTAAANTLFSPYQYSNNDTGLWFKPYANFETIRMSYVGNVRNNAYGAMIGADFAKKKWGEWSFIPTAFIGYNGGRTTYQGVGMWHNGGQGGLMGTLTRKNFITSMAVYAGGYHNVMNVGGYTDRNALWNVGVASKTAYNIHLPWDFILQPTLYMAYNYVGASSFDSDYDGFMHKVDPLNAYSVAPGLNLIWQKETFSIYALFQAMFNVNSVAGGQVAEIDMPHMGIRDPYFEYGLGVSKFFKDRFSGYGQAVARSGSRKGIGFQLGLNVKL